jgi:hypothetical protein
MTEDPYRETPELKRIDELVARPIEPRPLGLDPNKLPVAPWEGAEHRPWPLVLLGTVAVAGLAFMLFLMAGITPADAMAAISEGFRGRNSLRLATAFGDGLRQAPMGFHAAVFGGFVVINLIFFRLLRRAPRGVDASSR